MTCELGHRNAMNTFYKLKWQCLAILVENNSDTDFIDDGNADVNPLKVIMILLATMMMIMLRLLRRRH